MARPRSSSRSGSAKLQGAAGVVQWQNGSFPSFIRGFDSLHPLQAPRPRPAAVRASSFQGASGRAARAPGRAVPGSSCAPGSGRRRRRHARRSVPARARPRPAGQACAWPARPEGVSPSALPLAEYRCECGNLAPELCGIGSDADVALRHRRRRGAAVQGCLRHAGPVGRLVSWRHAGLPGPGPGLRPVPDPPGWHGPQAPGAAAHERGGPAAPGASVLRRASLASVARRSVGLRVSLGLQVKGGHMGGRRQGPIEASCRVGA